MVFRGWQKISLNEWPGKICSVVFVGGCNFRCPFCYNFDLVLNPEKLPLIKERQVLDYCNENKNLLDGVMITGGEPLINKKEDLIKFIKKIKKLGLRVGIETNGTNPKVLQLLIVNDLVDYLAMDVKAPLIQKRYDQITGGKVDLKKIRRSVRIIIDSNIESEFRTTVIPGLLNEDDILKIVKEIKGGKRYCLQQFQKGETLGEIPKKNLYSQEWFKILENKTKKMVNVKLRI